MTKKLLFGLLVVVLVALPLFAACGEEEITTTPPTTTTTPTEEPDWWDEFGEPEYGGTITVQLSSIRENFDTSDFFPGDWHMVYEALVAQESWAVDRAEYAFNGDFVPVKYFSGELAESWEMTDPQTLIIQVRQGVHWQNKAPVNGRELTAYDVQAHYDRLLAPPMGPHVATLLSSLDSVIATGDYALTVKFKQPGVASLWQFFDQVPTSLIEAPEYVALAEPSEGGPPGGGGPPGPGGPPITGAGGPLQDWHNIVGTGPWILTDFVSGTSMTLSRNPDYWGYDERHPENQLPYADTLKALVIPDIATAMAALRTGQIDMLGGPGGGTTILWQQVASLMETNPELKQAQLPGAGAAIVMRVDKAPFTDINVRKALNMAIDRPLIASGYYGGTVDGQPAGMIIPEYIGFAYPYSEWSQDLKDVYSYNLTRARELLAEAAQDGVFEPNENGGFDTDIVASSTSDLQLLQVLKANLLDIGVVAEITTMDSVAWEAFTIDRQHEQMAYAGIGTATFKPANSIYRYYSQDSNQNRNAVADPTYDAFVDQFNAALTEDEAAAAFKAADKYALEQAWTIYVFPTNSYVIYQPYLKGYSGEAVMWDHWYYYTARWWIDQALKESLGY
jgi:peptide/nickel transport system substrate-binding protein